MWRWVLSSTSNFRAYGCYGNHPKSLQETAPRMTAKNVFKIASNSLHNADQGSTKVYSKLLYGSLHSEVVSNCSMDNTKSASRWLQYCSQNLYMCLTKCDCVQKSVLMWMNQRVSMEEILCISTLKFWKILNILQRCYVSDGRRRDHLLKWSLELFTASRCILNVFNLCILLNQGTVSVFLALWRPGGALSHKRGVWPFDIDIYTNSSSTIIKLTHKL